MNKRLVLLAVCASVTAVVGSAMATDPLPKCAASKLKASGKKVTGKLGCASKAAVNPTFDLSGCNSGVEAKFGPAFTKADSKGVCTGDPTTVEGLVDTCVGHITDAIPVASGQEKCAAAKLKAAGKDSSAELGCHAKDVVKPDSAALSACIQKAETSLGNAITKADAKGTCPGTTLEVTTTISNNCTQPISGELPPKAPGCGNGVVEPNLGENCDDGNTVDGDACPHNCHIDSCTPTGGNTFNTSVTYTGPSGVTIAGLSIFVDYPEGKVRNPTFTNAFGVGNAITDVTYGFNAEPLKTSGLPMPFMHAAFQQCQGAGTATAADFSCTVNDASDDQGNVVPANQVTCTVTIP